MGLLSMIFGVIASVATLVGFPAALSALGFGSAGVTAGSFAAGIQGTSVASGSLFSLAQSTGAAGLAFGTKAVLFGSVPFLAEEINKPLPKQLSKNSQDL
ncbi:hypothetical protein MAR_032455 [Mya arenaria]|uniref:Uncharacterized protein n=1 Tax=Mya arenaria TaxID=6604 RepID=A0ABY7FF28_MYAAR|nr:hypothetical protein MAR_032455 [Mya arenaria]